MFFLQFEIFDLNLLPVWVLVVIALMWTFNTYGLNIFNTLTNSSKMKIEKLEKELQEHKEEIEVLRTQLTKVETDYKTLLGKLKALDKYLEANEGGSKVLKSILEE